MKKPKGLRFKSKDAVLMNANGRPVKYWHSSPSAWWLAWWNWLYRRLWRE
jgi:hypothetical protein